MPELESTAFDVIFRHGAELYREGKLIEAEHVCQQLLQRQPTHLGTLLLLGAITFQTGRAERAVALFGQAIAVDPDAAAAYNNRGTALRHLGRHREALPDYDRAIALRPMDAEAHYNRGAVLRSLGHLPEALASYDRAIALAPGFALAHYNRGNALRDLGRPEDALASYDQAIALRPEFAEAHNNRGNALRDLRRFEDALSSFDRAVELKPEFAEIYNNRANTLGDLNRHGDALADYDQAIECSPGFTEAHNNRGTTLEHLDRPEDALSSYERAIASRPGFAEVYNNRGNTLAQLGRLEAALSSYDTAIALRRDRLGGGQAVTSDPEHSATVISNPRVLQGPDWDDEAPPVYDTAIALSPEHAKAYTNRSLCQLALGDYEAGWKNFEWRWRSQFVYPKPDLPGVPWLGDTPIDNKTILVHAEQGLGDTLQFCRYVPILAKRATVILGVRPALRRLLSGLDRVARIVVAGEALPRFDEWVPMLSLPLAFRTTLATIPAKVPYLYADPERSNAWRQRLATLPGRKIGLVWAGSPETIVDRRRSIALRDYAPLALVPGVCLISLQKGDAAAQAKAPPEDMVLHDWTDELDDFADTAALVEALDLVISVDTSVVHLAGALGKPVWVLNRFDQCWRWLRDRTDSPWYPSARLFRQPTPGDWASVIRDVTEALRTGD